MKHSIVIPVGRFSFFVHANTKNIYSHVENKPIDLVFVTSNNVEDHVIKALNDAKKDYPIRVLTAPFNAGPNHLKLLDWAIREPSLNEWMITQHCDVFWSEDKWLSDVEEKMTDEVAAICFPNWQFRIDNQNMPIIGDTFGAYNRKIISDRNWSFEWDHLQEHSISSNVRKLIENGRLVRLSGEKFKKGDFLDGSVIMSLEMIAENPKMIDCIYSHGLNHLLAFFRIYDSIYWDLDKHELHINLPFMQDFAGCSKHTWIDAITKYSFLSSLVFDKDEIKNPLPWSLMEKISLVEQIDLDIYGATKTCEWISDYHKIPKSKTLGLDDLGIKRIKFNNKEYNFD